MFHISSSDSTKSSYYVWFLGFKESKGLRGLEYVQPVLKSLIREKSAICKLTLQVSHKGLKMIPTPDKRSHFKKETINQFIPHGSITCVYQNDDVISCILLVTHPSSDCPLFVHCYRCDSVETAELLKKHLQSLIERPENQSKFREIEVKLAERGLFPSSLPEDISGSDGRSLGRSSSSSLNSNNTSINATTTAPAVTSLTSNNKLITLYDSLAAELREKLNVKKTSTPLLLPPRDYDTVHRAKGNLIGIEERRAINPIIVGHSSEHSSSGIGSAEEMANNKNYHSDDNEDHIVYTNGRKSGQHNSTVEHKVEESKLADLLSKKMRRTNSFKEIQQKFKILEQRNHQSSKESRYISSDKSENVSSPLPKYPMEDFEKVWNWKTNDVPLTRELSPEYRQKTRGESRGRVPSPEFLQRRSSSRNESSAEGERPSLRREKTSLLFDTNRYPSLDSKTHSFPAMDPRRRSYHEPLKDSGSRNFVHSGKNQSKGEYRRIPGGHNHIRDNHWDATDFRFQGQRGLPVRPGPPGMSRFGIAPLRPY